MSEKKLRRCFVIGPIGKPGSPERKHADMLLNAVIREALEGGDPPYEIVRADKVAEPGMINDRVIHDILNADLVIADLTFSNANAYYELGIRHAAEKPVINFAQTGTELPFDTFGYRAIMEDITTWEGIERAREQIREQAGATEAVGYRVSNPITQANASFRMRESADPREKVLAELLERMERLEKRSQERISTGLTGTPVEANPSSTDYLDQVFANYRATLFKRALATPTTEEVEQAAFKVGKLGKMILTAEDLEGAASRAEGLERVAAKAAKADEAAKGAQRPTHPKRPARRPKR